MIIARNRMQQLTRQRPAEAAPQLVAGATVENILNETRLTMAEMCRWQKVSHNTVENWMRKGRKGIRLARVRIGGRWFTSKEAFQRWIEAINRADLDNSRIARASQLQGQSQQLALQQATRRSLAELNREAEEAVAALK